MKPGRKPKPTQLKLLKGEKRPSRVNYDEPDFDEDQIAPLVKLTEEALLVWNQLVPELARARVLKNSDCAALTHLVQTEAAYRAAHTEYLDDGAMGIGSKGQEIISPRFTTMMHLQKESMRLLTEFGMTPSSRQNVHVTPVGGGKQKGFNID
jgi:P27 family predicted phage terminase small subunit